MMEKSEIGVRIHNRRKELSLTQTQIKIATGISSGNLSDIEHGNKLPSATALIALSKILCCTTDWILLGKSHNQEILYDDETDFINKFHQLSADDRDEVIEIVDMKLRRKKKKVSEKLSPSADEILA